MDRRVHIPQVLGHEMSGTVVTAGCAILDFVPGDLSPCARWLRATIACLTKIRGREDVKKLISLIVRDFIFDPKCLPTAQRSLIRYPRAIFFTPSSLQILKSIFSHLPDGSTPEEMLAS
jgi:threonine dehydrogenase-like Zn-dependent dehydrogenase